MSSILVSIFSKYIEASLKSSFVILIIILLRLIFKGLPKRAVSVLWIAVWIRLLIPVSIRARFSFIPKNPAGTFAAKTINSQNELQLIFAVIWFVVFTAIILYAVISALFIRRRFQKLSDAVSAPVDRYRKLIPMYTCTRISSAFVYGVFRPFIVLPEEIKQEDMRCIILHEAMHIRCFDPLKKILAYCACAIHWANPLVWLAFKLFNNDIEMACDETVLRFAEISPIVYSQALLNAAAQRKGISHVSFGSGSVGARIRHILCREALSPAKQALLTIICVLAACILLFDPPKTVKAIPAIPSILRGNIIPVYQPIAESEDIIPEPTPEVLNTVPSDIPASSEQSHSIIPQTDSFNDVSDIETNTVDIPEDEMYSVITIDLRTLRKDENHEY